MFLRFVQVLAYNTLCIFMLQLTWACVLLAVLCHTRGTLVWSALQICQDGLTFEIRQDLYHWKLALVVEMLDLATRYNVPTILFIANDSTSVKKCCSYKGVNAVQTDYPKKFMPIFQHT
jgi:hypothetical protein